MRLPFDWPHRRRGLALAAVTAAAVAVDAALVVVNGPLETAEAPRGIVSLQLARTDERATAIVDSWEEAGVLAEAGFSSGLDFLFMPLYAIAGVLACAAVARRGWLPSFAPLAAWGAIVAAVLDGVETAGQSVFVLGAGGGDALAGLVWLAAIAKFVLLAAVLLYVVSAVPRLLRGRRSG